jgi:hypothetical protein
MATNKREIEIVIAAKEMVTGMLGKAIAAIGGFAAVTATIYKSVDAASEAEMAQVKLASALGHTSTALNAQAAALQRTTKFEDDTVTGAQAMVAAFTKNEDAIRRITAAAADLAAAKGMDLVSATELVTKSVYSEVNALGRYGISASGAAGSTQRLESMMRSLSDHFGGQASAQADTFSGRLAQMKNAFNDVLEGVGNLIIKNTFMNEVMRQMTGVFALMAGWLTKNRAFMADLVKTGIIKIIEAIGAAIGIVGMFHTAWLRLKIGMYEASGFIFDIIVRIYEAMRNGLLLPFDLLFKSLEKLIPGFQNPFDMMALKMYEAQLQHLAMTGSMADNLGNVAAGYDVVLGKIQSVVDALKGTKPEMPAEQGGTTPPGGEMGMFNAEAMTGIELANNFGEAWAKAWSIQAANASIAASAVSASKNIQVAAFQAVQNQLLRLVEQHKFSVGAIGQAVMQQAKMEVLGIAAKSAVYALFYLAYGLGLAAMGDPRAGIAFSAAAHFGGIAAATVATAAALNAISGPGAQMPGAGEPGGTPIQVENAGTTPLAGGASSGAGTYYVTLNVINPMTEQNADEAIEQVLIPALERAGARNVQLSSNVISS